jgi:hypothetical protein
MVAANIEVNPGDDTFIPHYAGNHLQRPVVKHSYIRD